MPDKTWKAVERAAATFFGALRNSWSGSGGLEDKTRSDSSHPRLYLEVKYRKGPIAAISLWQEAKAHADKEGKLPVVWLRTGKHQGDYLLIRADHLQAVAAEQASQEHEHEREA